MIIPVRCFTCGTVVASAWETYSRAVAQGASGKEALDGTGLRRFCCRRMLLSHANLLPEAALFE